ncbi:uncharacterized protein P884DRAFT_277564 [Thermothelomyces heterothallicus CBS 202.75]|uniref:uncharacterized protein n=1 Tax=Thermothelomyces heterothallicus CBS 202.75 TaxID=1149848 RepID=UPI003742B4DB
MAPVYADHPFALIPTPGFLARSRNEEPDMFDRVASEMALVHNVIIRGLNSIYLQAPHIRPEDEKPFCSYVSSWCGFLDVHHGNEEEFFFPFAEEMTGVKGIMDANIDQHKAFHDGVEELEAYAGAVLADEDKYDGSKVVGTIDRFGTVLMQHLTDEVASILSLRPYGDKLAGLPKLLDEEGGKSMKKMGNFVGVWAFANMDLQYENAMWQDWPSAPAPAKLIMRSVFWWIYADARKFGAVDRAGNLRHLYAVPESA